MKRVFVDKVKSNLKHVKFALSEQDEQEMNIAAYYLQQSIKLGLKQVLKDYGIPYSKTHIINNLINLLPEEQEILSEDILNSIGLLAPSLTEWEASSRYDENYLPVRRVLLKAYDVAVQFLAELEMGFAKLDAKAEAEARANEGYRTNLKKLIYNEES